MRILREAFTGIAAALTTSLLVMGAIVLAITEGMVLPAPVPVEAASTPDPMEAFQFSFTTPTTAPKVQLIVASTQPVATACPMPPGWEAYTVFKGDTLRALAEARQAAIELLVEKNCLDGTSLYSGTLLYLPPAPSPTPTALNPTATATFMPTATSSVCSHPAGWVRYLVRPGDTLFRIGMAYGVSVDILQKANCMGKRTLIYPGNSIYVPNVAPRYTATSVPFYPSPTAVKASPTRTFTVRPTLIFTPTFIPTFTPLPPTHTFTPSFTPTFTALPPTHTFTPTPTSTSTFTPTVAPTATFTPTPTATDTATPIPPTTTPTPSPTITFTPTGTNSPTPTSTPTATYTPTNIQVGN